MMRQQLVFLLILFSQVHIAFAQKERKDTILLLRVVTIEDIRLPASNPGLDQENFRTQKNGKSAQSLAEILSRNSASFIRQYSPGTLASPSIRGTGAAHTALIWNGLNLQSAMNGQLDLSLIPAQLFDQFTLQKGASAASWGSGAIGGAITLNSDEPTNHFRLTQNSGSWGFKQSALDIGLKRKSIGFRVRVFETTALNNFRFQNDALFLSPIQRQTNAAQFMKGLMQDIFVETGKHSYFQLAFWGQYSKRHIPPIQTIPFAVAHQIDRTNRLNASWKRSVERWDILIRGGFFQEEIGFKDSLSQIDSRNNSKTSIIESEFGKSLFNQRIRIQVGGNASVSMAKSQGLGSQWKQQNRKSIFASFRSEFLKKRLENLIQIRQEWYNNHAVPFIPSFSSSFNLVKNIKIRGQLARTFRLPTLNDLYWQPGGNSDLLPEHGLAMEAGFQYLKENESFSFLGKAGIFSTRVKNWILWVPGLTYWKPENIQQVFSRGEEIVISLSIKRNKTDVLRVSSSLQYVNSSVEKSNSISQNRQLIYVPKFTWNGNVFIQLPFAQLDISSTYTGLRYTTSDNASYLPAFWVFNVTLSKEIAFYKHTASIYFQVNNMFNSRYQVIAWRPMPLRSIMAGISFSFHPTHSS